MSVVLLAAVVATGCADGDPTAAGGGTGTTTAGVGTGAGPAGPEDEIAVAGGWEQLPTPPLAGRTDPTVVDLGDEVLVVGGWTFTCGPAADCGPSPDTEAFADGAAHDLAAGTWREVADAPVPTVGAQAAVLDGDAYLLGGCPPGPVGCDGTASFLRYRPVDDAWDVLPPPPQADDRQLAAVDGRVIAFLRSADPGGPPDLAYDPGPGSWAELPDDGLPSVYDRQVIELDGELAVLGAVARGERRAVVGATLDASTGAWTALPAGPHGFDVWVVDGRAWRNGHVGPEHGGVLDPAAGSWSRLPGRPPDPAWSGDLAGVIGPDGAAYGAPSGWALSTEPEGWVRIPPHPGADATSDAGLATVGRDLWLAGGQRATDPTGVRGTPLDEVWRWRAPEG